MRLYDTRPMRDDDPALDYANRLATLAANAGLSGAQLLSLAEGVVLDAAGMDWRVKTADVIVLADLDLAETYIPSPRLAGVFRDYWRPTEAGRALIARAPVECRE